MAAPTSILNTRSQSTDTLFGPDGVSKIKLGIGSKAVSGLTALGAWQGVATHIDGATFAASDGVIALAGVEGTTVRKILVDSSGHLLVAITSGGGALTNISGSIAAGATAQTISAATPARRYFFIQNLDASEDLWINFGTAAVADQPSIKIEAGGSFSMEDSFVSTQLISVIAATTGHKYTAKEG